MKMTPHTLDPAQDPHTAHYRAHFLALEETLDGERSQPVHALRTKALARFEELGFPTPRHEEWRFTNLAPVLKTQFTPVVTASSLPESALHPFLLDPGGVVRLVCVDGVWSRTLSHVPELPSGVRIRSLTEVLNQDPLLFERYGEPSNVLGEQAFTALNGAFLHDGVVVSLADGTVLDLPVHVIYVSSGREAAALVQPRTAIITGHHCSLSVVETFAGLGGNSYLTNAMTQVVVGDETVMEHDRLQLEGAQSYHVGTLHASIGRASSFASTAIAVGGALVRNNITAVFRGEGGSCTLNGLSLASGAQLIDNHTAIDHVQPHCESHENYKAILSGKARGVFNGKIFVRRDAQKTDARQTNKTLLLSDEAVMNTKPQLEIFADDVKCTHGATVGQLDEEQVFYLRSRGIGQNEARDLLTFAFADDIVQRIHVAPLREKLGALLRARLQEGHIISDTPWKS